MKYEDIFGKVWAIGTDGLFHRLSGHNESATPQEVARELMAGRGRPVKETEGVTAQSYYPQWGSYSIADGRSRRPYFA